MSGYMYVFADVSKFGFQITQCRNYFAEEIKSKFLKSSLNDPNEPPVDSNLLDNCNGE